MSSFQCLRCGRCCLNAGSVLNIEQEDVDRWKNEKRHDILSKLYLMRFKCDHCKQEFPSHLGDICPSCGQHSRKGIYYWIDPKYPNDFLAQTMLANPRCPFLKKTRKKDEYSCLIQDAKPEICRDFPQLKEDEITWNEQECEEWGCKGYTEWKKTRAERNQTKKGRR